MKTIVLSCGIFARELECLDPELLGLIEPRFLDSMLHMRPALLEERLSARLAEEPGRPTVLLYGDCCPRMEWQAWGPKRTRTAGVNCIEILLGRQRYAELRREGAFFFMAEWLARWREIFGQELGFADPELARGFMQESASKLVYVDTGCAEFPAAELETIGRYFGLPWSVERPGLSFLESALRASLGELRRGG